MSALNWRPGTIYAPGSVVRPNAVPPPPAPATLENPDFEAGASGWTVTEGALAIVSDPGNAFNGTYIARLTGPTANSAIQNDAVFPVVPGQQVTARCMIRVNAADQVGGTVAIVWLDSSNSVISSSEGNQVNVLGGGVYRQSAVTAIAPAGAVACKIAGFAFALQSGTVRFDAFSIVYQPPVNVGSSLVYRAVQPNVGTSDATEPAWPTTVGQQVNDGTVVWEAIEANIVLWEAEPILITGGTEPDWPTVPGAVVEDNGIIWRCIGRNVRDERCPNSKVVAIGAAKVFAADDDIIRYSATGNPLDWSTQDDAGFLPSGLQQNGANRIDVLNLYRSNLVALNASTFQMWQIDPDPEQMALLDAMEGIGSVWQKAAQPVSNDLFLLSALGVRTVGIAVGSTNLQAGDVGMPIDSLVQEAVAGMPAGSEPKACYYPAAGQYWLFAGATPQAEGVVFVGERIITNGLLAGSAIAQLESFIGSPGVRDFSGVSGVGFGGRLYFGTSSEEPASISSTAVLLNGDGEQEPIRGASLSVVEAYLVRINSCPDPLSNVSFEPIDPSAFSVTNDGLGSLLIEFSGIPDLTIPLIGTYLLRVTGTMEFASGQVSVDFLLDNPWDYCI